MKTRYLIGLATVILSIFLLVGKSAVLTMLRPEQASSQKTVLFQKTQAASAKEQLADCRPHSESVVRASRAPSPEGLRLVMAAGSGNTATVASLLASGIPVDSVRDVGWTAMYVAAVDGHLHMADFLVKAGAAADQPNIDGNRPLSAARTREMAEFFIRNGADVRAVNDIGRTALHNAIDYQADEVAALLLSHGADVNARWFGCRTALQVAAYRGRLSTLELLQSKGAELNLRDKDGKTALHEAIEQKQDAAARWLVQKGTDTNIADASGITPLMRALLVHNEDLAVYLLSSGADFKPFSAQGETAMHIAAGYASLAMVRLLIDKGTDVNAQPENGGSPLDRAEQRGDKDIVQLLLGRGAQMEKYRCEFDGKTYTKGIVRRGGCPFGWTSTKL